MNDDYWQIEFPGGFFYYGYERTYCEDCKRWLSDGMESCDIDEDHKTTWGFHGKIGDFECKISVRDNVRSIPDGMELGIFAFMYQYQDHLKHK